MTSTPSRKRSGQIAAAMGAMLVTAGCAALGDRNPSARAGLPTHLDGGVGQLLRYCDKFYESGDLVTAAALCERAHRLEPTNPAPLMRLAEILTAMERRQQAVLAYQRILQSNPDHIEARYTLGKSYIALGQFDLAAEQFRTALGIRGDDPRLFNALGIAEGMFGAHDSAQQSFRAGLALDPAHVSLRNNLALSLVLTGHYDEGTALLEDLAANPAADAATRDNLQLAYGLAAGARTAEAMPVRAPDKPESAQDDREAVAIGPYRADDRIDPLAHSDKTNHVDGPIVLNEWLRPKAPTRAAASPAPGAVDASTAQSTPLGPQTANAATVDAAEPYRAAPEFDPYLAAGIDPEMATPRGRGTDAGARPEFTGTQFATIAATDATAGTPAVFTLDEHAVQFASYLSEERAWHGWQELQGKYGDSLAGIDAVVRRADLGPDTGVYYRLGTEALAENAALALCAVLEARGAECLVITVLAAPTAAAAGRVGGSTTP